MFVATVDHGHAADLTAVVGHQKDAVTRGTATAVGVVPIIVTVATARRAALAAAVVTRAARAVATEVTPAVVPPVAIVTTEKTSSRKPTTVAVWWSVRKITAKRPSHRDQQTKRKGRRRSAESNEKAARRPIMDQKTVLQVRCLNRLTVAAIAVAIAVVAADRQTRTTNSAVAVRWSSSICSGVSAVDFAATGRYLSIRIATVMIFSFVCKLHD